MYPARPQKLLRLQPLKKPWLQNRGPDKTVDVMHRIRLSRQKHDEFAGMVRSRVPNGQPPKGFGVKLTTAQFNQLSHINKCYVYLYAGRCARLRSP
jgi:hypothetical protein